MSLTPFRQCLAYLFIALFPQLDFKLHVSWDLVCLVHIFISNDVVEETSEGKKECRSWWLVVPQLSKGLAVGAGFRLPEKRSKEGNVAVQG